MLERAGAISKDRGNALNSSGLDNSAAIILRKDTMEPRAKRDKSSIVIADIYGEGSQIASGKKFNLSD